MRFLPLLGVVLSIACFGQTVYKNGGARLGSAIYVDCQSDAGVNCTRTASTSTVNFRCSTASATELGCVSTSAQSLSGEKTFTGGVRAPTFGGADGGVYVKTSDGASLIGAGVWSVFQPYGTLGAETAQVVALGAMGNTIGENPGIGSAIRVIGLQGLALVDGLNTDGGMLSIDGGAKGYWLRLSAVDDAGTRLLCNSFQICESGIGLLHQRSDTSCGADGGGVVNRNGFLLLSVGAYDQSGDSMAPECEVPAVNYSVNYTGIP